ncbi:hypothetical protein ACUHMQ_16565 [Chitinimonas sp. PSY-7]
MQELKDASLVQVSGGGRTKMYGVQVIAREFCEVVLKGSTKLATNSRQ